MAKRFQFPNERRGIQVAETPSAKPTRRRSDLIPRPYAFDIGIEDHHQSGHNSALFLFRKHSSLPYRISHILTTIIDSSNPRIIIKLVASETGSHDLSDCIPLAELPFDKPADEDAIEHVVVELTVDPDGRVYVSAFDNRSRKWFSLDLKASVGATFEEHNSYVVAAVERFNYVKTLTNQSERRPLKDSRKFSPPEDHGPSPGLGSVAAAIRSAASGLPEDYDTRAVALANINHTCRQELAEHLGPALNAKSQAMPHDDLDGKKAVCEFVNGELERLGLAVKCPKTGFPAKLKATTGHWAGVGRFHFEVYIDGKLKKPAFSDTLPMLELIDANPTKELEMSWQNKVGPKASRTGRKLTD